MKSFEEVELGDILPVEFRDENRIEIEVTDFKFIDFIWAAGLLFLISGIPMYFFSHSPVSDRISIGMILGGILFMLLFRRKIRPSFIFIRGSKEIRIRKGLSETRIDLETSPFRVHTKTGGRGARIRAIWIQGRYWNKKGAQMWCKGFPPLEQVVAAAAFLNAFIHGEEHRYREYIPEINISGG